MQCFALVRVSVLKTLCLWFVEQLLLRKLRDLAEVAVGELPHVQHVLPLLSILHVFSRSLPQSLSVQMLSKDRLEKLAELQTRSRRIF